MTHVEQEPGPWNLAPMGERGLLMTWRGPGAAASAAVRGAAHAIGQMSIRGVSELVPAIESLLVCYDPFNIAPRELRRMVAAALPRAVSGEEQTGRLIAIPVSYGGAEGPDLADVAAACGLAEADVVASHTAQPMPVLMLGFLPGFPYIGGLPAGLRLPRRAAPRIAVAAGSVAIANDQTGIYPSQSPGGWHVIGRTDTVLFDPFRDPPALLRAGDLAQFVAVGGGE